MEKQKFISIPDVFDSVAAHGSGTKRDLERFRTLEIIITDFECCKNWVEAIKGEPLSEKNVETHNAQWIAAIITYSKWFGTNHGKTRLYRKTHVPRTLQDFYSFVTKEMRNKYVAHNSGNYANVGLHAVYHEGEYLALTTSDGHRLVSFNSDLSEKLLQLILFALSKLKREQANLEMRILNAFNQYRNQG